MERRSPRDLSAIDEGASPEEVRPLVNSLNRLFGLVNAQAESQRRFVADAAHQLRTPLAGLQAQVEAWAQAANAASPGDGTVRCRTEQVNKLRGATRRTSQLANQLLALSRADARGMHAQPMQRVDLKALCEDMPGNAPGRSHGQAHRPGPGRPGRAGHGPRVAAARAAGQPGGQRREVHATKAAPSPSAAAGALDGVFLEVEDDGPGVAPAERQRILERFYRVQGTQGEGNGLGLAIAEEIARVHHSHLRVAAGSQRARLEGHTGVRGVSAHLARHGRAVGWAWRKPLGRVCENQLQHISFNLCPTPISTAPIPLPAPEATAAARKRPKPGERRVQILQALATMLEQPGAERITTAALAARLEVSEAALYRHFASKAQMFEGLIEFIEQSVFTLVNQIAEREPAGHAQAAKHRRACCSSSPRRTRA